MRESLFSLFTFLQKPCILTSMRKGKNEMVDLVSGTASQLYPVRRKPTAAYTRNVLGNPEKYSLFKGTASRDGLGLC
jgi:hypothetical protein